MTDRRSEWMGERVRRVAEQHPVHFDAPYPLSDAAKATLLALGAPKGWAPGQHRLDAGLDAEAHVVQSADGEVEYVRLRADGRAAPIYLVVQQAHPEMWPVTVDAWCMQLQWPMPNGLDGETLMKDAIAAALHPEQPTTGATP